MSDSFSGIDFDFEIPTLEKTPKMHGDSKEEQFPDVAPGWYANCYCCGKTYEEKYMVRQEYRREETIKGSGWYAQKKVTRYVISFCVWCQHSFVKT